MDFQANPGKQLLTGINRTSKYKKSDAGKTGIINRYSRAG